MEFVCKVWIPTMDSASVGDRVTWVTPDGKRHYGTIHDIYSTGSGEPYEGEVLLPGDGLIEYGISAE